MSTSDARRRLEVWLEGRAVGELREQGNVWALAYDQAWQVEGFDLSPALPRSVGEVLDGGSHRPVQWFFDNLLPEEGGRRLIARDAGVDVADAFGLLQRFGPESAGALTLLRPGEQLPLPALQPLTDSDLSARIRALPRQPLTHGAPKRMSLAGAQHKLPVVVQDAQLWEPVGTAASTHILKPDHEHLDDYPHSVVNEWFCMQLAAACGLPVPHVAVRRVPEPVYLVRRFDRRGDGLQAQRLYALDGCQLLSLDRIYKYQQATSDRLRALEGISRMPAATRIALLRWQVFNFFIGNSDAHLKNLSFLRGSHGWELAPHYDLLSTSVYKAPDWGVDELVFPMGNARRYAVIGRDDVAAFGASIGIPPKLALRSLDELAIAIRREAHAVLQTYEQGATHAIDPGEARLLRQIVFGPLEDALRRVA
ncbi:HipA domain-containing protein [Xanthomonas campestris]|uniref:HipA domain-containing protein n=1 Tax=Xanthomonas campestris TaxID=339 RepID=UPI001E641721|nr:HipA domain-containing protein [Xanthomonas campestris]MCC5074042.1 HipA domain-containing protein [Xanthomonas campestris pv. plantaginis]MEA9606449.1 HipA domain-containing protein [Xanthomonas campestris pv. plantaginis]